MQLPQYLICLATRHEKAKEIHEQELRNLTHTNKKITNSLLVEQMTYPNELVMLQETIKALGKRPRCLKKLSNAALGCFAYIFRSKMASDLFTEGHEIIAKLACNPELSVIYLESLTELQQKGWLRIITQNHSSFTDQPPYSLMQTYLELGETFHKEMGVAAQSGRLFTSNDTYLDAVFSYLENITRNETTLYRVTDPEQDLTTAEPHEWYRQVVMRVEASNISLPAYDLIQEYKLSIYQYLCLIGLLGKRDGDIGYDFRDTNNVVRVFAQGRICRKRMREHLFGETSQLIRCKLLEPSNGSHGESIHLSHLAIIGLIGNEGLLQAQQQLQQRIKSITLFDYEEPTISKDALMLPETVMESIRALIFSETKLGHSIREKWYSALPSAWGSPTGSTVLLYGPPGTGKTLTAQYLASEMKLPLLKIDASKILSCWVGNSEQNVRRIFDDYAAIQRSLGKSPLLLMNEADQLLGSRGAGEHAVDRMNNNMQNLFLEGLERFTGILVATTNRRDLLDDAFGRRFTYKLELPQPDRYLRQELWKQHLPKKRIADDVDIGTLAELNLSGGEIRLVVERAVRMAAFKGSALLRHDLLWEIAQEELTSTNRTSSKRRIGF